MVNRITVNSNQASGPPASKWREQTNSTWDYQLNPTPATIESALEKGMTVAARIYDPFGDGLDTDNRFHLLHTPAEAASKFLGGWYADYFSADVYWLYGWNEPVSESDEESMRGQLAWFIDFADRVPEAKLALGGWNISKTIKLTGVNNGTAARAEFVEAGVWDDLLQYAHNERDRIILDIHIYTACRVWWNLKRRLGVPADSPDMKYAPDENLQWESGSSGLYPPQWHVGRSAPLIDRARKNGWRVRFGVGECIWDYMDDVRDVLSDMERRWGMPEFNNDFRGIRSLRAYYQYLDTSDDLLIGFDELAYSDMVWLDEQLPPEFEYIAVFAGNFNPHWTAYNVFHPDMAGFLNLIAMHESDESGDDMPNYIIPDVSDWTFNPGTVTSTGADSVTRMRQAPTTGADIVGNIDYEGVQADISEKTVNPNSTIYQWRALILENGQVVWAADDYITVTLADNGGDNGDNGGDNGDNGGDGGDNDPDTPTYIIDFPLPNATITVTEAGLKIWKQISNVNLLLAQAIKGGVDNARPDKPLDDYPVINDDESDTND